MVEKGGVAGASARSSRPHVIGRDRCDGELWPCVEGSVDDAPDLSIPM